MRGELGSDDWIRLAHDGYLRLTNVFSSAEWAELVAAANELLAKYPYGFIHAGEGHDAGDPKPRLSAPRPDDYSPTIIIPHIGFRATIFHKVVEKEIIYNTVSRVLGPDFVLSNTWLQAVPPGAPRLAYHKDPRGSFSFTVLLDEQGWNTGSTCIVPGSHQSTPPPRFCVDDPREPVPGEIQIEGEAGDVCFFSPETWHGRAANAGDKTTVRLFFACYGRRSHDATMWTPAIGEQQLAEAMALLPSEHRHLLQVDGGDNRRARQRWNIFRRWFTANGTCSEKLIRDFFFCLVNYTGNRTTPPTEAYYSALIGESAFSPSRYFRHIPPLLILRRVGASLLGSTPFTAKLKDRFKAMMNR